VPRTQSSLAVRGERGPWFLLNASPDLRTQMRELPIGGVVLTDGEIDHVAGLLLLRESHLPLRVWSTPSVRAALSGAYPLLPMLERYCGVTWSALEFGETVQLADSSLELEPFATGGDAPLYMGDGATAPTSIGLSLRDTDSGASVVYAPALAALDPTLRERLERCDCAFLDGTFWANDELLVLGVAERDAEAMGHLPLGGPQGTLTTFSALPARTILVHINNTNPILLEDSPERREVESSGVEVSYDGLEVEL
jgi:pyrroloquinoline quinone biosynthesis protein B